MIAATLLTLTLMGPPSVPDELVYAIAAKETGSVWRGRLVRRGLLDLGADVSPWQISRAVLHDLHASRSRAACDPVYAESLVRRWLAHLLRVAGSWPRALAAYHCGLRRADTAAAREYAQDCMNLAALYTP